MCKNEHIQSENHTGREEKTLIIFLPSGVPRDVFLQTREKGF
ncbi:hypothetical protein BN137_2947 [Cronobacter condimenti 1330]|uniref:Uncharacterized protein n=1 Tax=Cronobacter condimenti 1330 TaxID=1073999 RepID=K8A2N8_9ENTR|nr:hypothetical protein BN137_2947 [Cronobacter condimenti 1330]